MAASPSAETLAVCCKRPAEQTAGRINGRQNGRPAEQTAGRTDGRQNRRPAEQTAGSVNVISGHSMESGRNVSPPAVISMGCDARMPRRILSKLFSAEHSRYSRGVPRLSRRLLIARPDGTPRFAGPAIGSGGRRRANLVPSHTKSARQPVRIHAGRPAEHRRRHVAAVRGCHAARWSPGPTAPPASRGPPSFRAADGAPT